MAMLLPRRWMLGVGCWMLNALLHAQAGQVTALNAAKLLPKEYKAQIARIEAFDGTPLPERWHILVYDPKGAANGHVREFVVADGQIVANRVLSQFAESIEPDEVIKATMKTDSDRVLKIARDFAAANQIIPATFQYSLLKFGDDATPAWKVTARDRDGGHLGHVIVSAITGNLIARDGFDIAPETELISAETPAAPSGSGTARPMPAARPTATARQPLKKPAPATR